jgi:hypothetical protein
VSATVVAVVGGSAAVVEVSSEPDPPPQAATSIAIATLTKSQRALFSLILDFLLSWPLLAPAFLPIGRKTNRHFPTFNSSTITSHDQGDDFVSRAIGWENFSYLASASHHHGAVGDLHDMVHGMGDHDHSLSLIAETVDQIEDTPRLAYSEGGRWFVEDDHG